MNYVPSDLPLYISIDKDILSESVLKTNWDSWADDEGSIGKAYGYQQAERYFYTDVREVALISEFGGLSGSNGHVFAVKKSVGGRVPACDRKRPYI